jgi:hypothetical protein
MVRARRLIATLVVGLFACVCPAVAQATATSTNWAGYAIHRSGESFRQVVGIWREPRASCRRGRQTYSSYWVGLGGYSSKSRALEQTGTEVDCTPRGRVRAFAWFELVPAPSVRVHLKVPPGDLIEGAVAVTGRRVRVSLHDLTRHTAFSKVVRARVLDLTSAEWIVEAPSECLWDGRCVTLPLANFGSTRFANAAVQPTRGRLGSISDTRWSTTKIRLIPRGQGYVSSHRGFGSGGAAAPSRLRSGGSGFSVSFAPVGGQAGAVGGGRLLADGRLVHPGN